MKSIKSIIIVLLIIFLVSAKSHSKRLSDETDLVTSESSTTIKHVKPKVDPELFSIKTVSRNYIDITPEGRLKPAKSKTESESGETISQNIAIVGTNDLHGKLLPSRHETAGVKYESDGGFLFTPMLNNLRKEWGEDMLWFDGGDHFRGSYETENVGKDSQTRGKQMEDFFFNAEGLDASSYGNHEFDFGFQNLKNIMRDNKYETLASNLKILNQNGKNSPIYMERDWQRSHVRENQIFDIGNIKVGAFGLTTIQTPEKNSNKETKANLVLDQYKETMIRESRALREAGADIVVMITHVGADCTARGPNAEGKNEKQFLADFFELKVRDKSYEQTTMQECQGELYDVLQSFPRYQNDGTAVIDAVVGGHIHKLAHHYINGYPVVIAKWKAEYFNILYFQINKSRSQNKVNSISITTTIEGPVPVCQFVFENVGTCKVSKEQHDLANLGQLRQYIYHDRVVDDKDEDVEKMINDSKSILSKSRELSQEVLTNVDEDSMRNTYRTESALGNFFTDSFRDFVVSKEVERLKTTEDTLQIKGYVCVIQYGGLRAEWEAGDEISMLSLHTMLPFPGKIARIVLTGHQLKQALIHLMSGEQAFYHSSGIKYTGIITSETDPNSLRTKNPQTYKHNIGLNMINGEPQVQLRNLVDGSIVLTDINDADNYALISTDFLLSNKGNDFNDLQIDGHPYEFTNYQGTTYSEDQKEIIKQQILKRDGLKLNNKSSQEFVSGENPRITIMYKVPEGFNDSKDSKEETPVNHQSNVTEENEREDTVVEDPEVSNSPPQKLNPQKHKFKAAKVLLNKLKKLHFYLKKQRK